MGFKPIPGGLTTWVVAAFAGAAGLLGATLLTSRTDALYVGANATGTTIFPADPIAGDYLTVGGRNYVVYNTTIDADIPDSNGVNCTGDACSASTNCGAAFVAVINADPGAKVSAGRDGGVGNFQAKDAGMAANLPIVWYSRTRATATETNSATATGSGSVTATATETATGSVLITATGTDTATDGTWTVTGTAVATANVIATVTKTITASATVTATNSTLGLVTKAATGTVTTTATISGTGSATASETVTGSGTDVTTGSATATTTKTITGTASGTVTATMDVSGTATSTFTTSGASTSVGTSTGMKGGADPGATGGPSYGVVANTFNPATSGLIARPGITVCTVDETKCWTKTGTGNTDWTPINTF